MTTKNQPTMDPYKTMCVVRHDGREVGRIPATAPNAGDYITEMVSHYGHVNVEYVYDENAAFIAMLHERRN